MNCGKNESLFLSKGLAAIIRFNFIFQFIEDILRNNKTCAFGPQKKADCIKFRYSLLNRFKTFKVVLRIIVLDEAIDRRFFAAS